MQLTALQVLALAPDASSASAGRKLGAERSWQNLGKSDRALWGECQGSALYQVRIDLSDMASKCTCPSRKFPCKHALGILLLAASTASAFTASADPEWVSEWLDKRAQANEKKEARAAAPEKAPDPVAQAKRAEQRTARVIKGIDALDLWMSDLIKNGLAGVEHNRGVWEQQAARLVDAQAPGLASQVRRLAEHVGGEPDWPVKLLDGMGKVALLTQAFRRIESLSPELQADVRQLIGWSLSHEEVIAANDLTRDDWLVAGQVFDEDDRVKMQRTWLVGVSSARIASVLHFAAGSAAFTETFATGTVFTAELCFWPSACPTRAMIGTREGATRSWNEALPGSESIESFLSRTARRIGQQPWIERSLACLSSVTPYRSKGSATVVRDASGDALRLSLGGNWTLFALSGGQPIDLVAEWDGHELMPLAAIAEGAYHQLSKRGG